ncbi:response regulator transcription factor [Amycolatopsis aidingensis]|uniref:response regulator transcription factor n=1 Tax=Amycolatopsis aidingensis TaxID=2842453 RepID=UPI001C0B4D50|nr:response regulator transcription factor [Amycolatopsis aidingensis]
MRILVVDDEEALAEAIAEGLTDEGFTVDVVHDGREALWLAREGNYSAIVLDVLLPGMDGFAVCQELRRAGGWTPVLMLTVRNAARDERDALDLGADDFLGKPFDFSVLVARLRALIRRPRANTLPPVRAGDLELDLRLRTCRRAGTEISLSAREFTLLHALLERPGTVVPRHELRDRVWGWDFDGNPGILDVYIGYLRNKVDRPFGLHTIRTVRGVGYLIEAER